MRSLFLSGLITLLSFSVFAGGSLNMTAKIRNFSPQTIEIEDAKKIYSIQRDKLGPEQNKKIDQAKAGADINLQIPFDAMTAVRLKK
jgi:hypothetical protein